MTRAHSGDSNIGNTKANDATQRIVRIHFRSPYGEIAVLLRAIREAKVLPAIEMAFQQAGIPYAILGGADASGSRSLELFSAYLWLLLPGDRRRELLQVLESPPFAIGHASMVELFGESGNEPGDAHTLLSEDRVACVNDNDAQHRLRRIR